MELGDVAGADHMMVGDADAGFRLAVFAARERACRTCSRAVTATSQMWRPIMDLTDWDVRVEKVDLCGLGNPRALSYGQRRRARLGAERTKIVNPSMPTWSEHILVAPIVTGRRMVAQIGA